MTPEDPLLPCGKCPSENQVCVTRQRSTADIAIVVDHPSSLDASKDQFFTGDAGKLVREVLHHNGIRTSDTFVCSALNCRPNTKKEAMLKNAMLSCRERLISELKLSGAKKVLCLGPIGFSALASAPRNLPITKTRGRWHEFFGMQVLPTFNPTMVMGVPDYARDFYRDVEKFAQGKGRQPWPKVDVWTPESIKEMREAFKLLSTASFASCDTETTGFNPTRDKLLAVGFCVLYDDDSATSVVLDEALIEKKATWREMCKLIASKQRTVFHNAKFDLKFLKVGLRHHDLECEPRNIEDTMLLNYCLDERPMGRFQAHSLKNLARVRCDAPDYDIHMGKWLKEWETAHELDKRKLRDQMHTYLALDTYYTARLYPDLSSEVENESVDLVALYEDLLMPGMLALADIELHGILIDRAFYEETSADLAARAKPVLKRLQRSTGRKDFNPNSPPQVKEYLYTDLELPVMRTARRGKQQEGPTAKPVLKMLKKKYPKHGKVIDDILMYRTLTKTAGTYVNGIIDRVDDDDRIRGDFLVHGTATGRLSSSNPNLQNIPEASHTKIEVRNGFIAPDGYVLIEADYSQLELRIAAHFCQDGNFVNVFKEDRDIHQEVAFAFFGKPADQVTKYERYMAKCMNFGVVYGRGPGSLANGPEMEYVEEIGGTRWSKDEVGEFFKKFFANFPGFHTWMEEQTAIGYQDQVVVSPLGRRRRFPFIPQRDNGAVGRQAVNTPIQGTASDFTFAALIRIHDRLLDINSEYGTDAAYIVSTVHDSILIECLEELVDEVLVIVREEMEDNVPLESDVPFKSDADVARKWGQMGKYKWDPDLHMLVRPED